MTVVQTAVPSDLISAKVSYAKVIERQRILRLIECRTLSGQHRCAQHYLFTVQGTDRRLLLVGLLLTSWAGLYNQYLR